MSSSPSDVVVLIGRLRAAVDAAGLPPVRPAGRDVARTLERLDADIAPLRLPADLREFWSLVDVTSISVATDPVLQSPAEALDIWHIGTDETGATCRVLFPFCNENWVLVGVELDTGTNDGGGACFTWALPDDTYDLVHVDFLAYLELLVTFIETGEYAQDQHDWIARVDDGRWSAARSVRLAAAMPHAVHGTRTRLDGRIDDWPLHWQLAEGVTEPDLVAHGATTTIAALLAQAAAGHRVHGTIHATVSRLASSGAASRMTLSDGTGDLDAHCDHSVVPRSVGARHRAEFDVVLRAGTNAPESIDEAQREIGRVARQGDVRGASELAGRMLGRLLGSGAVPAQAEITMVRPLPDA